MNENNEIKCGFRISIESAFKDEMIAIGAMTIVIVKIIVLVSSQVQQNQPVSRGM